VRASPTRASSPSSGNAPTNFRAPKGRTVLVCGASTNYQCKLKSAIDKDTHSTRSSLLLTRREVKLIIFNFYSTITCYLYLLQLLGAACKTFNAGFQLRTSFSFPRKLLNTTPRCAPPRRTPRKFLFRSKYQKFPLTVYPLSSSYTHQHLRRCDVRISSASFQKASTCYSTVLLRC